MSTRILHHKSSSTSCNTDTDTDTGTNTPTPMDNQQQHASPDDLLMIALYYWYIDIPKKFLEEQVSFHQSLCANLNLFGRIRISTEGLNGVLSGTKGDLKEYEYQIKTEIEAKFRNNGIHHEKEEGADGNGQTKENGLELQYGQTLDVKYCHLRTDLSPEKQLFDSLSVKVTKEVVSLNETETAEDHPTHCKKKKKKKKKNKGDRYEQIMEEDRRRKEQEQQQQQQQQQPEHQQYPQKNVDHTFEKQVLPNIANFEPATHLSPKEWNEHLLSQSNDSNPHNQTENPHSTTSTSNSSSSPSSDAILIDARNIYESKIGYFCPTNIPTLLTNTRKYSTITSVLHKSIPHMAGKNVYMYCTGGVRCERASVYLQALANSEVWPEELERPKGIYQLEGGIQKYLEEFGTLETELESNSGDCGDGTEGEATLPVSNSKQCLFKGKNFVFDQRRYDPMVGTIHNSPGPEKHNENEAIVGQCLICSCPFDDYDNGHAPCENMEARCCRCRVLVLVCNGCRGKVRVWGQEREEKSVGDVGEEQMDIFCGPGGKICINEGNSVEHYEIIEN